MDADGLGGEFHFGAVVGGHDAALGDAESLSGGFGGIADQRVVEFAGA